MPKVQIGLGVLYAGLLVALAFIAAGMAHADGYRGKKTRYYAAPFEEKSCLGPVRGVGTQWIGTDGAMDAAKKDWTERTRYDHGEIFVDMDNAEGFRSRCGRTSIGQVAGQVLFRCEVWARPCKAAFEKPEGQR